MVEYNFKEDIKETNTLTGNKKQSQYLYYQLRKEFVVAERIDIIVSFLMFSGVKLLLKDIRSAIDRGVPIRILTGKYLNITQPDAIALLKKEFGDKIDLRFCLTDTDQAFHPKSYIFHKQNGSDIFIGSSNISYSALTSGIEWNYKFNSNEHKEDFEYFYKTFVDLFENHSVVITDEELKLYAKNYHKPAILRTLEKTETEQNEDTSVYILYEPRGAQVEALYALDKTRQEGADKALIYAATGIGKTYLAAFDSKDFKRVLFVAHQEEILKQAAESFKNVRVSDDYGFFYGKAHDTDKAVVFASVQSLGKPEYLNENYFSSDYFDYIVVDEFHHAVNKQYVNIINYFKPKFLLGLTATPDRTDGRNIYEICDYNVPFEISLFQAINRGLLVPFHYYGIYDETDYSNMRFVKGDYLEADLNEAYINNDTRSNLIYKHYLKYNSKRALGFCCSRLHAEYMAKYFCSKGIPSVAVYSNAEGEYSQERDIAIQDLKEGRIKVIFSVNMFNEGVDIPSVDTVMFLRPTQSDVLFLQQLGRGLRISHGKDFLNVLDFIGNYKYAGKCIRNLYQKDDSAGDQFVNPVGEKKCPDGCLIDFDLEVIDLFNEINKRSVKAKELILEEFYRIKELLDDKIPARMELFTNMNEDIYELCLKNSKDSPFKNYLEFLNNQNLLSSEESELYNSICKDFLNELERTDMTKSYKMPVLLSLYNDGNILESVGEEQLLKTWKKFFAMNGNWKDLPAAKDYDSFKIISDKEHLSNIKKNPVNFLVKSSKGFFVHAQNNGIAINSSIVPFFKNESFIQHFKDIIDFRTIDYYSRRYREKDAIVYPYSEPQMLMVADSGSEE